MSKKEKLLLTLIYDSVLVFFIYTAFCSSIWLLISVGSFWIKLEEPIMIHGAKMNNVLAFAESLIIFVVSAILIVTNVKWKESKICFKNNTHEKQTIETRKLRRHISRILWGIVFGLLSSTVIASFLLAVFSTSMFFAKMDNSIIIFGRSFTGIYSIIIALLLCIVATFMTDFNLQKKRF